MRTFLSSPERPVKHSGKVSWLRLISTRRAFPSVYTSGQWLSAAFVAFTVAGPRRNRTGLPLEPRAVNQMYAEPITRDG